MNWLDCPITDAIQKSKSLKAIFVVYITGTDDQSQSMDQTWQDGRVISACEQVVAVKLLAESDLCKQFLQIYPVRIIPSVYFIGDGGVPLEVVSGSVSPTDFLKRIENVKELHQQQQHKASDSQSTDSVTAATASPASDGEGQANAAPLDDRLKWAEEMREERRRQKNKQKEEEERQKEMERRELGKDMAKFKEWKKDRQREQEVNEWKKEKEAERQHKDLVKQQIERDREEKAARFRKEQDEKDAAKQAKIKAKAEEEEAAAKQAEAQRWTVARLQFRLPDGSTRTRQFPATDKLSVVSSFLNDSVPQLGGNFVMTTLFPKRTFEKDDMSRSLAELELVPSASIVVVPGPDGGSASEHRNKAAGYLSMLLALVLQFFAFLYSLVFGRHHQPASEAPSAAAPASYASPPHRHAGQQRKTDRDAPVNQEDSPASSSAHSRANRPKSSYGVRRRQEGNVHRLTADDSDSESATWNGNSTQQM